MARTYPYNRDPYNREPEVNDDDPGSTRRLETPKFAKPDLFDDSAESASDSTSEAPSESSSEVRSTPPPATKTDGLSVLGPTVCFKGELTADEDLMIQGQIEGSIHHKASHLTIGSKGKVKADIHANHIIVQGEVTGDMYGTVAVVVESSARVQGNIYAPSVALKEGAKFKGSIDMDAVDESPKRSSSSSSSSSDSSSSASSSSASSSSPSSSKNRESSKNRKSAPAASDSEVNDLLE